MTHQNLRLGKCWKLFLATLSVRYTYTIFVHFYEFSPFFQLRPYLRVPHIFNIFNYF